MAEVFNRVEDTLVKEFNEKQIAWPPKALYVRTFKYDRLMEVWVRTADNGPFQFLKSYHVCMESGTMGPKRVEGDFQVPEGFYYIDEFNPNSNYHLSLGINYPNASDRILSDQTQPGGDIYIHGNCVSTGCLAITDVPIEELYIMGSYARSAGQDFIPVHVFPVKYDVKKSMDYLNETTKENKPLKEFALNLKHAFDYFEEKKQLPIIMINKKGEYIISGQ
ncbi:MAG TPA: L,D-transpeptidase family protein [Ferruginibacter sp.]|nr:L,D-transpeptidase family protein [Ferruginibacter sp.]